ncbi:MAG TPA: Gfo/Idh/MocA family oxidoreductase [Pirellulales bacterium]|jgi:predicted dehydrogenase|nr:Gfo/Idh/MocA family oxidoreductase [Pirellulales bacterium]
MSSPLQPLPSSNNSASNSSRREFLKTSGVAMAGAGLAATLGIARQAHAAQNDDAIRVALIGCGGRGGGAVLDAMSTGNNIKLVAMADAFKDRLDAKYDDLKKAAGDKIAVDDDHKFVGFDAYQKAIDSGVDLVILATPPGFRPIHFNAAVQANKNIFMEKPVATDPAGVRKVLQTNEEAKRRNLIVGVGLQRRHQPGYLEALKRYKDGAIGELVAARAYWNGDRPHATPRQKDRDATKTEMEYQMRNWYFYVWLCGDHIVEQHIHNLDVINWFKGETPVRAVGMGGSQVPRQPGDGEIYDHHAVEFQYADGSRVFSQCRQISGCWGQVSEHIHGTKGAVHLDAGANRYSVNVNGGEAWNWKNSGSGPMPNPYQIEHADMQAAIKNGGSYNEADYGAKSTMTAILGRLATYSGKEISWEDAFNSKLSIMPTEFSWDAKMPVNPGPGGMYPQAIPGLTKVI